jgi:DNA-binding Xre family transcriptional regulator
MTVDYREDGLDILLVKLNDGGIIKYDDMDHSIRRLGYSSDEMSEDDCRYEFRERLARIMLHKRISQAELSDLTGLTQATISHYLTGRRTPSFYNADKIAKALGCSTDEFRYID